MMSSKYLAMIDHAMLIFAVMSQRQLEEWDQRAVRSWAISELKTRYKGLDEKQAGGAVDQAMKNVYGEQRIAA